MEFDMKQIEIDDDLYHFLASKTEHIGESASSILRRLLAAELSATVATSCSPTLISEKIAVPTKQSKATSLFNLLNSDKFNSEKKQVSRFILILSNLYQSNQSLFTESALRLKGTKRVYLAQNKDELLKSGNATKPKLIPDSPFWVVSNINLNRKILILDAMMKEMNIESSLINLVKQKMGQA